MKYSLFLGLALLTTGCGVNKSVHIDSSEAPQFAQGSHQVGLLQVRHVNTGDGFGLPIEDTYNESFYCTVSVVSPDTVVTSTDCLQTIKDEGGHSTNNSSATSTSTSTQFTLTFDPKDMAVHLPVSGKVSSTDYEVASIAGTDGANHLAFLKLKQRVQGVELASAISLQSAAKVPNTIGSGSSVTGFAVSATAPDENGISHLRRSDIAISFTATPAAPTPLVPTTPTATSTSTATGTGTSTGTNTSSATLTATSTFTSVSTATGGNPAAKPAATPSVYSQPQSITVSGLKDGSFGAPVFFNGTMIGIVQNGSADQVTNGQWIVATPNPTLLTP
jgi:hypothetical protein